MKVKDKIISLLITFIIIKVIGVFMLSDASWRIQKPLFNYIDHTEVINNVIQFNDITKNEDLTSKIFGFGNSQLRSIFRDHLNNDKSDFYWSYVGGLRISALPYYLNNIKKAKPKTMLLYLSDKDLNYTVLFHSLFNHPLPIQRYFSELPNIIKFTNHTRNELVQIGAGEFITPLKFSYQLKHLVDGLLFKTEEMNSGNIKKEIKKKTRVKSFEKIKLDLTQKAEDSLSLTNNNDKPIEVDDKTKRGVKGLLQQRNLKLNPPLVEYNLSLLTNFVEVLIKEGIDIIIVEGQYHPLAFNDPKFANEDPHLEINKLADKYPEISVIKLESQITLSAEDYTDHIHFTKEGGKRLKEAILSEISKM